MALSYQSTHSATLRPMVRLVGMLAIFFASLEIICASTSLMPFSMRGRPTGYGMDGWLWLICVGVGSTLNLWEVVAGVANALRRPHWRRFMLAWAWCELFLQAFPTYMEWSRRWGYLQHASWTNFLPAVIDGVRTFAMWGTFPMMVILFYSRREFREAFEDYSRVS
jgi:hypothetical protein